MSESEAKALALYRELLKCAEGHSVVIEEYARQMVYAEELHASEVDKMRRKPDKVTAFRPVEHLLGNRVWTADPESNPGPGSGAIPPEARSITDPIKEQLANAIINDACFHPGIMRVCRVDLDVVTGKTAGALSRGMVQRSDRTVY